MSERTFDFWDDPSLAITQFTRYNSPGMRALTYRSASYHTALARMLANLPVQKCLDQPDVAPLGKLNVSDRQDWTVTLLQAWAAVTDVLTFYQERITNEGYLSTALEDRSILELTRSTGYTIPPGISAGADLAFTVSKRPDQPHQVASLPAGLAVQSTATPGRLPQIFETSEPFEARSEWNALIPASYHDMRWRRDIREDTQELRFAGVQTGLSVGDTIIVTTQPWMYELSTPMDNDTQVYKWLDEYQNQVEKHLAQVNKNDLSREATKWILLFEDIAATRDDAPALLVKLTSVNPVPAAGTTVISWEDPIEGPVVVELGGSQWGLAKDDLLLVVGKAGGDLGPEAPRLVGTISAVRAEPGFNRTTVHLEQDPRHEHGQRVIPNPRAYALRQKAALFTYTSSGLFANTGRKKAWQPEGIGLPAAEVRDIIRHPSGLLFAATAKGLFRSVNDGATWHALSIGMIPRDVHCLTHTQEDYLLAGTDKGGVFLSKDLGDNWIALSGESVEPFPRGLRKWFPQLYALGSLPKVVVRDLVTYQLPRIVSASADVGVLRGIFGWLFGGANGQIIAAATDVGIFRSTDGGRSWRPANHNLPKLDKKTGLTDTVVSSLAIVNGKHLFAATNDGIYHVLNRPRTSLATALRNFLILAAAILLFSRLLLGALTSGTGPLYSLSNPNAGWIGQLLSDYINALVTLTSQTIAMGIFAVLALFGMLAAFNSWRKYLDARERTGIEAYTLLVVDLDNTERLYAGTQAGVFQAEPGSKILRLLGRPFGAWQPVKQDLPDVPPLFLIKNEKQKRDDLDEQKFSAVRADFARLQDLVRLPAEPVIEAVERGTRWLVRGDEDRQVFFTIQFLDDAYLLVYHGPVAPVGAIPLECQEALDKADISKILRTEFTNLHIPLQESQHIFIASPKKQWYILNKSDVPVYEIWRIDDRLVVIKAQAVHALDTDKEHHLLAGTTTGELYLLDGVWRRSDVGLALTMIDKIKTVGDIQFVAGAPPEGSTEKGWESAQLNQRLIDLDRVYPSLQPGSLLLLQQNEPWQQAVYTVHRVTVVDSEDFLKKGQFTRVAVDIVDTDKEGEGLDEFNRNTAAVWSRSEPLALHDDRPVYGETLIIGYPVPGLVKGRRLIMRGKPMRARISNPLIGPLKALVTPAATSLKSQEILKVLKVDACPGDPKKRMWRLENADHFVGTVEAGFDQIVLESAADDDSFVNEVVELAEINVDATQTLLVLKTPFGTCYDRSTATVLANIVPATHGQTVADEVLGSSPGGVSYERLRLRQGPLTFLPNAKSSDLASTLHVYVNGVEWQPEPFFSVKSKPDDRVYVLQGDEYGGSTIIFGNGLYGARLPANTEQVTVSYRIGSGPEGNVPADSLTNLQTRVANLQDVINPLPASGGVGREDEHLTRQNAPRHARASQRIISLTDYADFTAAYPGIGKARAELVMRGSRQVICITVAACAGQPVAADSLLFRNLRQAIDAQRAQPTPEVDIQTFSPVFFNVRAKLFIRHAHYSRREELEKAARASLAAAFGFEQRDLGQEVTPAELLAVLHTADAAIVGVEILSLARTGDYPTDIVLPLLPFQPGELLMINAEGHEGIAFEFEESV